MKTKDIIGLILISPVVIGLLVLLGGWLYGAFLLNPYVFIFVGILIAFIVGVTLLNME
jgi:hypothetical protein